MPDIHDVIRKICLHLPDVQEVISHGSPDFRVAGKTFATFSVNHHGDGRLGLLLNASLETQAWYLESAPKVFYVPQYVGHKGWYGIDLAAGMRWDRVAELTCDAYQRVAPRALAAKAAPLTRVPKPDTVDIKKIDPFFAPANQALLARLKKICMGLPEVTEGKSFGSPVFKAGKKTFCEFSTNRSGIPSACFRVGPDRQGSLVMDKRYDIPAYTGHNGWIRLRIDQRFDPKEIESLAEESYRHFALKRMLKELDGAGTGG